MLNQKTIVAVIPARGGSKGVPRKNIKPLHGKPLIAYTIAEALKSRYLDRVIVSTEDEEIANISKNYGAEVPFLRPEQLALDTTPGIDPVIHCVNWLNNIEDNFPDYVCVLQCTSPFRKAKHIDESIENIINHGADSIVSVCESEITPYWMKKIEKGFLEDFLKEAPVYKRRQDAPKIYRLNGAIYLAKSEVLMQKKSWYTDKTLPYVMNRLSSVDIDDMIDFKFAEFLMKGN